MGKSVPWLRMEMRCHLSTPATYYVIHFTRCSTYSSHFSLPFAFVFTTPQGICLNFPQTLKVYTVSFFARRALQFFITLGLRRTCDYGGGLGSLLAQGSPRRWKEMLQILHQNIKTPGLLG
jgi:hypothetical protein